MKVLLHTITLLAAISLSAQPFYLGADLSYVNEMEDCGVVYREQEQARNPYDIFADRGANLVRLRLWHTPSWYDQLNGGRRYGDLADVRRSIRRARAAGMAVLLDFHLSDTWADPSRQLVPAAWAPVVDNLPVLEDSLYGYIYRTLAGLAADGLLPELVQIGNETNRGILQSQAAHDAGWKLDWPRNARLFKKAIAAVRDIARTSGNPIQVALHVAGPTEADWLLQGFWDHGVRDFDIIGLSYYWAWHQPTSIAQTGQIIAQLRQRYPGREVMIFETAYIWTTAANDAANNIINTVHPDYAPASPANQRRWLIDLTQEVIDRGGRGVIYWEPAWVSSPCRTLWGQGSHQEHAAFFDFKNNLLPNGGIGFFDFDYRGLVNTATLQQAAPAWRVIPSAGHRSAIMEATEMPTGNWSLRLLSMDGRQLMQYALPALGAVNLNIPLPPLSPGVYVFALFRGGRAVDLQKTVLSPH